MKTPAFHIADIPIYGDAILSPMDGYSDLPFRGLCRQLGSAMSYTEFVNCKDVVDNPKLETLQRRLIYAEWERPVVFQIFDDEPERMLRAAVELRKLNPDIIDINMGCPSKTVAGRGAGSGLLLTPDKVAEIFSTLSKELDIPITGKIRIGWDDDNLNHVEIAQIIEDNGGQLVAVHGRTRNQKYKGQANWKAIAEVKAAVNIPVIGNGDVKTPADIKRMKAATGADGVMIGRGAIGNPWIFSRLRREEVPTEEVHRVMLAHLADMLNFYDPEHGLLLFRKHAKRYLAPYGLTTELRQELLTSETPAEFSSLLEKIISYNLTKVEGLPV